MDIPQEMQDGARAMLAASVSLIESDEWHRMTVATAVICAKYYKTLIAEGVPEEAAGAITAAYAAATAQTGKT